MGALSECLTPSRKLPPDGHKDMATHGLGDKVGKYQRLKRQRPVNMPFD